MYFLAIVTSAAVVALAAPPTLPLKRTDDLNNVAIPTNFTPSGGADTSPDSPPPVYQTNSDFDFQSLNLALNQEYIELDLFHHGLAQFSVAEFEAAGISADDRFLIEFMADQEAGHAQLVSNILGRMYSNSHFCVHPFVLYLISTQHALPNSATTLIHLKLFANSSTFPPSSLGLEKVVSMVSYRTLIPARQRSFC